MKKKILIVQHHGKFGGSSKSIFENISNLKKDFIFDILCPYGSTYNFFKRNNVNTYKIIGIPKYDITEIGSYRGFRKLLILREIIFLPFFIFKLFLLSKNRYDLIHLNDTNLLVIAPLIKLFFKSRIVCHIRTRVDKKRLPRIINLISKNFIDKYVCIDKTTFSTTIERKKSIIVYNILNEVKGKNIAKKFTIPMRIGFLGTLDFHKGLDFLFKCIVQMNKKQNNFKFIIAGDLSVKNNLVLNFLDKIGIKKNFNKIFYDFKKYRFKNVEFLGSIDNLKNFYSKIDLICFPSRMNALGRPVIEASYFKIPSIVCLKNYFNDTIIDKKTGYVIKFGNVNQMIKLFHYLERNRFKIIEMGNNARKNFNYNHNVNKNLKKIIKIYLEK